VAFEICDYGEAAVEIIVVDCDYGGASGPETFLRRETIGDLDRGAAHLLFALYCWRVWCFVVVALVAGEGLAARTIVKTAIPTMSPKIP